MPHTVVMGATLQCTCGSAPSQLAVTSQYQAKVGDQLAATVKDHNPIVNIPPFGICSALTAAAAGVPAACMPAPAAPWVSGSTTNVKIGQQLALLSTDILMCTVPGIITVIDPGQKTTQST
jgi:hypothetical protein